MWHRVFGSNDVEPAPAELLAAITATGHFQGDASGWFRAEIVGATAIKVERFLASEDGIRAELNSWAAHVETCPAGPHRDALMEKLIQTRQLFTFDAPLEGLALARYLARVTDGIYQIDAQGFFNPDGVLLVVEC